LKTLVLSKYIHLLLLLFFLAACNTTRKVPENNFLLKKNKLTITNPNKEVDISDLTGFIQPIPNKKFLGVLPLKLWWYNRFKKGGEAPVLLNQSLIKETENQFDKYLGSVGFFNSTISHTIEYPHEKKSIVEYTIDLSTPYRYRNIKYTIKDDSIQKLVLDGKSIPNVKPDDIFNAYKLDEERNRISSILNRNGYYKFSKDFIYFEIDSMLNTRQLDVNIIIKNISIPSADPKEEPTEIKHSVYYINKIHVYPDYKPFTGDSTIFDTLRLSNIDNNYDLIYEPPLKIKPKVIIRSSFIEKDKKYNALDARETFKKLNNLSIYRYVNVNFREADTLNTEKKYLDCNIQLARNATQSYSVEAQGTNSGGDLGFGGYLVYQNRNLFRGGEVFNVRLKLALEAQSQVSGTSTENKYLWLFNTLEYGVDAKLLIPKFLAPISQDLFSRYFRPKTSVTAGYNFQDRQEYTRIITNVAFGYEWSMSKFINHILSPVDINLIKVSTTPEFDSLLLEESERFRNQYTDNLIFALKYSYIFNNQEINKIKNFTYFRGNIEFAGNMLDAIAKGRGVQKNEEGYRTFLGIRYSQYVKTNFDFRYYIPINPNHAFAFRAFLGVAIPYGNSIDIPFEKGYYGGGANGMRAWQLRYLGPGAYPNTNGALERVGDVMIESNFEYRFPIFNVLKGAFFYDVGNIWLLNENETFPGGKFNLDSFVGELAMDGGLGLRLDFKYFIFRIDIAQRITDPALPAGNRFVIGSFKKWFKPVANLGIGYPF
jgi:outer membrane protein assembly factor BamA